MAALAVMLMTLLVVQAPIATVDRLLHDAGRGHPANAFLGAVVDLPEHHDRGHDHDEHDDAPSAEAVPDEPASDRAASGLNHHHHHDGPSVYSLTASLNLPIVWSLSTLPFRLDDDLRKGIDAFQQDRPPKTRLAYVA